MPDVAVANKDSKLKLILLGIGFLVLLLIILIVLWASSSDTTTISGQISNQDESATIDLRVLYYEDDISKGPIAFKDYFDLETSPTGVFSVPTDEAAVAGATRVRLCVNNELDTPFGEFGSDQSDGLRVCAAESGSQEPHSFDLASCEIYPVSQTQDGFLGAFKSSNTELIVGSFCNRNLIVVNDDGTTSEDVAATGEQQELILQDNKLILGNSEVDLTTLDLNGNGTPDSEEESVAAEGDTYFVTNVTEAVEGGDESLPQTLTLSGDSLRISGGNTIDLSKYLDDTDTNTDSFAGLSCSTNQILAAAGSSWSCTDVSSLSGETITTISVLGSIITYTNEDSNSVNIDIQDLETTSTLVDNGNGTFTYTNEDGVDVTITDIDTDDQTLTIAGNTLTLANGDGPDTTVDLSAYLDNTDSQDLSLSGNTLSLTNDGTTVDLSPYLDNTDAQDLSLSGNTLALTNDGTTVDLAGYLDSLWTDSGTDTYLTDTTDNVGIGLTDPSAALEVSGPASTRIEISGDSAVGGTVGLDIDSSTRRWGLGVKGTAANGAFILFDETAGERRLTVDDNGDFGIGDTSPDTGAQDLKVDVEGAVGATSFCDENGNNCFVANGAYLTTELDGSISNEIQDLSRSGNVLSLTSDATTVDLSPYLDNTDNQALSISGNNLELTSDDGTDTVDLSGYLDNTDNQDLSLSGNTLSLTNDGTTVDLSGFLDNTDTLAALSCSPNQIAEWNGAAWACLTPTNTNTDNQQIALAANVLTLSNGTGADTTANFSAYLDNTDNQDLTLTGNTLSLTNDGTTVDLSGYLDNTDSQDISLAGTDLSIDSGSTIDLSVINTDSQDLTLTGNTLALTNDGTTVDLSSYLDNTDAQDLALSGNTLSLTNDGTTVDLATYLDNTDNQALSISGNNLELTSDDGTDTVDLSGYLDNTDNQDLSLSGNTLSLTNDGTTVDLSGYLDSLWTDGGTYNYLTSAEDVVIGATTDQGARFAVVGNADETQVEIAAHSTQTSPIILVNDSAGSELFRLSSDASSSINNSLFFGYQAGANDDQTANRSVGVGSGVLSAATNAELNTAIGADALGAANSSFNTAVGAEALELLTVGEANVAVGYGASGEALTASRNTALGNGALFTNISGENNVAIGFLAGFGVGGVTNNSSDNVFIGDRAGHSVDDADGNIFIGKFAGNSVTDGDRNIVIGYDVDLGATTTNTLNIGNIIYGTGISQTGFVVDADAQIGIGTQAPSTGTSTLKLDVQGAVGATEFCDEDGNNCTAPTNLGLWTDAGSFNYLTNTTEDVVIGATTDQGARFAVVGNADETQVEIAAHSTQTSPIILVNDNLGAEQFRIDGTQNAIYIGYQAGAADTSAINRNVGIGFQTLNTNSSGNHNTAVGYDALSSNTTGSSNVALGSRTLVLNQNGSFNIGIGDLALDDNVSGSHNIAVGRAALTANTGDDNTAIGSNSLAGNTIGADNAVLGARAFADNLTGSFNTILGSEAGDGADTGTRDSDNNVIIGYQAGVAIDDADNNILVGYRAGNNITTGSNNIVIGYDVDLLPTVNNTLNIGNIIYGSGIDQTGFTVDTDAQIGIGDQTPDTGTSTLKLDVEGAVGATEYCDEDGNNCAAATDLALWTDGGSFNYLTNTTEDVVIGASTDQGVKFAVVGDTDETQLEVRALTSQSSPIILVTHGSGFEEFRITGCGGSSSSSFFAGYQAGQSDDCSANQNVAIGARALSSNTTGNRFVAIGTDALRLAPGGSGSTAVGANALSNYTSGAGSTAFGSSALRNATTGIGNTAVGGQSLDSLTIGSNNTGVGHSSLSSNLSGDENTAVGQVALGFSTGSSNTAVGMGAFLDLQSGDNNVAVGRRAGNNSSLTTTDANRNVLLGSNTANELLTSDDNIIIGYDSGDGLTTGSRNIVIGYNVDLAAADTNRLAIGNVIYGTGVNQTGTSIDANALIGIGEQTPGTRLHVTEETDTNVFRLEDSDGTCNVNPEAGSTSFVCSSDARLKSNVVDAGSILDYVEAMRIREYTVNASGDRLTGVIAQELQQTHPELVTEGDDGYLQVKDVNSWQLIKAIQELDAVSEDTLSSTSSQSIQIDALASDLQTANSSITTNTTSITTNTDNIDTLDDAIDIISIDITNINDRLDALEAFDADNFTDIVMDLEERVTALESGSASSSSGTSSHAIDGHIRIDSANDLAFITNITFEEDTTFEQDVAVLGDISFNSDQVGQATIDAGDTSVDIDFTTPYSSVPVVTVTLAGSSTVGNYYVSGVTASGFTINIDEAQTANLKVNWNAFTTSN